MLLHHLSVFVVRGLDEVLGYDKVIASGKAAANGRQYAAIAKDSRHNDVADLHFLQRTDKVLARKGVIAVLGKYRRPIGGYLVKLLRVSAGIP